MHRGIRFQQRRRLLTVSDACGELGRPGNLQPVDVRIASRRRTAWESQGLMQAYCGAVSDIGVALRLGGGEVEHSLRGSVLAGRSLSGGMAVLDV